MDERTKLLDKANRHYAKQEYAKAIEAFLKYLGLNPADAQAAARLGDCYALTGGKDKAIRYYAKAAELYALTGAVMKAIGLHKRVLVLDPSMADPNAYLSYLELSRLEAEIKSGEETGVPFLREESRLGRPSVKAHTAGIPPSITGPPTPPPVKPSAPEPPAPAAEESPLFPPPKDEPLPLIPSTPDPAGFVPWEAEGAVEPVVSSPEEPVFELETTSQAEFFGAQPSGEAPSPPSTEPVFELEITSQLESSPAGPSEKAPSSEPAGPVFEIETTSQTFTVQEPEDKGIPLELLLPLTEVPAPEPLPPPPTPPPPPRKPLYPPSISIQAQQEALMKKMGESGLGPPSVPSSAEFVYMPEPETPPPAPAPPVEEKFPSLELEPEPEEIEAPAAPLDFGGEDFDFQIKLVPGTVELPHQEPRAKAVEQPTPPPAFIPDLAPETPVMAPEFPGGFELSLPEAHELREALPPKTPPPPVEPVFLPQPVKPPIMDLSVTPIKTSQPSFKIPLLKELTPPEFIQVCEKLKVHRLKRDTVLFRQGDPGDSLFFINSGKVKIYLGAGGEDETLAYLKEGELFGEFAFLTGAPRQANVKTDRETELLELSREDLEPVMEVHPRIKEALISFYKERALNNVLNQTVIFKPLGKIEKALVASNLNYKSYPKGEVIIEEGTMGDELYFLVTGKVRVTAEQGMVFLADLYPPELFGEISLITNQPRTATVTAATPVEVLYLKKDQLLELLNRYPKMQGPLKQLYEARLQDTSAKVQSAKKSKAEGGAPFLT